MPPHEQDDEDNDDSMEREVSGRLVLPGRIHCGLNHVEGWGLLPKWQSLPLSLACVRTSQNCVHSGHTHGHITPALRPCWRLQCFLVVTSTAWKAAVLIRGSSAYSRAAGRAPETVLSRRRRTRWRAGANDGGTEVEVERHARPGSRSIRTCSCKAEYELPPHSTRCMRTNAGVAPPPMRMRRICTLTRLLSI
jgi:hypothetical protein